MAVKRANIFDLIEEARRRDAELRATFDAFNAAEISGDEKALARQAAIQRRAVRSAVRADARVINTKPSNPSEVSAQLKFYSSLAAIPDHAYVERMIRRAAVAIERALE